MCINEDESCFYTAKDNDVIISSHLTVRQCINFKDKKDKDKEKKKRWPRPS